MVGKRISVKGLVGIAIALIFSGLFYWTFSLDLLSEELLIPRISLALLIIGGVIIFLKDILNKQQNLNLDHDFSLLSVLGVSIALYIYYVMTIQIGLIFSTFVNLFFWWFVIEYIDYRRTEKAVNLSSRVGLAFGLSILLAGSLHLLFITFLNIYFPPVILF